MRSCPGILNCIKGVMYVIYLDNAATTKVSQKVLQAMLPYFEYDYGNAGSIHQKGRSAKDGIEAARCQVAKPIGAAPNDIIFTSCGSEANSLVLLGLADHLLSSGKKHIITSNAEHDSVLESFSELHNRYSFDVSIAKVNSEGIVTAEEIEKLIRPDTGLVSVMAVNNELGTKNEIYEIGQICHDNGILFHSDCVQAYCNIPLDVGRDQIDFLSVSGHKFHAPKGVGFLYAKRKEILSPYILGGKQESGLRAGTENVPGIVGIGKAAEIAYLGMQHIKDHCAALIDDFKRVLTSNVPGVHVNGAPYKGGKILNLRFDNMDGETLLLLLDSKGICVSAGSACAAHSAKPSHVLKALGLTDDEARASIRISVSEYNSRDEINLAAKTIIECVNVLKGR